VLCARIESGALTGLGLARRVGVQQAHISNFLNRKRGLSLAAMDRVLEVEHISVLDLLDPVEIRRLARTAIKDDGAFEGIPMVEDAAAARQPSPRASGVLKFQRSFLRRLRPEMEGNRHSWKRFILFRVGAREGMSMFPRLLPGAVVLVDRHYNSLKSYRRNESNMYAVGRRGQCAVTYVEVAGRNLLLRPHNTAYPVEVLPLAAGKSSSDHVIGRVCYVGIEA
jgi:transcriptional regulator with XRE-family HTH domain